MAHPNPAAAIPATAAPRTALVAGATGLVGRELLALLLADTDYAAVHCVGRRAPAQTHRKLVSHALNALTPQALAALALPALTDVYIALGTTIKVAGSQQAFKAIDLDAVVAVAGVGRSFHAMNLGVVSAMGANAGSRVFYNRIKGEMEAAVSNAGYASVTIARPSFIAGDRASLHQANRTGEGVALAVARWLAPVTPANYRAVDAASVALALHREVKRGAPGNRVLLSGALH